FEQRVVGLGVVGLNVRPRPGLTRIFLTVRNLVQLTDDIVSALVTHALAFRSRTSRTSVISIAIVAGAFPAVSLTSRADCSPGFGKFNAAYSPNATRAASSYALAASSGLSK